MSEETSAAVEATVRGIRRREGMLQNIYYKWSKEFIEAGKQRLLSERYKTRSRQPGSGGNAR